MVVLSEFLNDKDDRLDRGWYKLLQQAERRWGFDDGDATPFEFIVVQDIG